MRSGIFGHLIIVVGLLTGSAVAQTPSHSPQEVTTSPLTFQIATIKPSRPDEAKRMMTRGSQFLTNGTSVVDLLKYAYSLHEQEIAGGPEWLKTEKFDVVADAETQSKPSSDEYKRMVQELLRRRFRLGAHNETRELSVFEIVPAKGGPKLQNSKWPDNRVPTAGYAPGQLSAANATVADFATFLQRFVTDRPVVDESGIKGKFDLTLRWTPEDTGPIERSQDVDANSSLPGIFTAIQEQLGLKLQLAKRPTPVFVIDTIELPSEN